MTVRTKTISASGTYYAPETEVIPVWAEMSFCTSNISDLGGHTIVDEPDEP